MFKRILSVIALLIPNAVSAQDAPLPPRVAAMKMTLPPGFKATLFAGEPDVVQPIAFCFDDRGRLWVAECLSYPNWQPDPKAGKDRIVIFEEGRAEPGDGSVGSFSKRTVFADNIQNISGINYGFGGIWVCATPNLLFIPIKDDKPAGPPEIVLDGWSLKASHNVFNSLTWGPDGWLYGCNGIVATSYVGRPGTPEKDRVPLNCGVWRYHPTKKKFEAVAHGTTNPWGLDFDEHGEMFITNCVIDHLWHVVPGAHYQRMYGNDLNPHVYKLMPSICDHLHWGGGSWTSSRAPNRLLTQGGSPDAKGGSPGEPSRVSGRVESYKVHSEAGGGHAHVGCMIYLGDNWPDRYRNGVFMCNLHGNRINHDILERNGSTYVARHGKDFMLANDPWFRGIALQYGPDGGVYVSDWTDTGECHNYKIVDRTNGRIFKITYGDVKPWKGDLAKLSDLELAGLQLQKNEWMARHARRLLQERKATRKISKDAVDHLLRASELHIRPTMERLRILWALHSVGGSAEKNFAMAYDHRDEYVRSWAARLVVDHGEINAPIRAALVQMARKDSSPLVKLNLAGAAQRADPKTRLAISTELLAEPMNDPYLPLMSWYAIEPSLLKEPSTDALIMLLASNNSLIRENISRRITEVSGESKKAQEMYELMFSIFPHRGDAPLDRDCLRGIQEGLAGRRNVPMPKTWKDAYPILIESPLAEVRERALVLAVQFGDERAFTLLRKIVPDRAQSVKLREDALKTLLFQQKPDLVPVLHELLNDEQLRAAAIRGLAAFDDPQTPKLLLDGYAKWNADEKADAIQTLSARGKYALALLDAIDAKAIPRGDLNSYTIRQLQALKSAEVAAKLTKIVGEIRPASQEKAKLMAKYKADLKPNVVKNANLSNGRALFAKTCMNCHRLFGEGGAIGPDLTGAQRTNLDYILENVLDPNAIVPREYKVTVVVTKVGRTLSGIVKNETDTAITLQLPNEIVVVPMADIDTRVLTKNSMMPEGIFEGLRIEEVRDLVGYLASPVQVPMKKQGRIQPRSGESQ